MKVPLLDLKAQYAGIREDCRAVIDEVCDSQHFILGPGVEAFEKNIADYCGSGYAVGVSSGTDAILAALMAFDVGPGDAVVTTPYTFFATVGCIARLGATPVLVDIDPVTFNMDPRKCREFMENIPGYLKDLNYKVLMPVHLYGQAADMKPLMEIAHEFGMKVIEDAAQAIGAEYDLDGDVKKVGSIGDAGCFSFFPSKNLGGFGDGGMITVNDPDLAEKIRQLRNHGSNPKYYHSIIGGNFRLDTLQAAVLNVKLGKLDEWHQARRNNAAVYDNAFKGTDVMSPVPVYAGGNLKNFHIYNQYVVRLSDRDSVKERLVSAGIGCEIYYPVPLHMQKCFEYLEYDAGEFPESEKAAAETLALPIYPELTREMQDYVIENMAG